MANGTLPATTIVRIVEEPCQQDDFGSEARRQEENFIMDLAAEAQHSASVTNLGVVALRWLVVALIFGSDFVS